MCEGAPGLDFLEKVPEDAQQSLLALLMLVPQLQNTGESGIVADSWAWIRKFEASKRPTSSLVEARKVLNKWLTGV